MQSRNIVATLICIAALRCTYGQSIACANNVDAETARRTGPGGAVAVLKVHAEDDHGKNSHQCEATYTLQLLATGTAFFSSVAEWGRTLSLQLDGFSGDGRHVFGVISEGGRHPFTQVFDFATGGSDTEIQVPQGPSRLNAAHCGTSFAVAGTANSGEIVLEPNTTDRCRISHRWLLDKSGKLIDMPKNAPFTPLYTPGRPTPPGDPL